MQVELEIMSILSNDGGAVQKADSICRFMSWDKGKLMASINRHGVSDREARAAILNDFWGKQTKKHRK